MYGGASFPRIHLYLYRAQRGGDRRLRQRRRQRVDGDDRLQHLHRYLDCRGRRQPVLLRQVSIILCFIIFYHSIIYIYIYIHIILYYRIISIYIYIHTYTHNMYMYLCVCVYIYIYMYIHTYHIIDYSIIRCITSLHYIITCYMLCYIIGYSVLYYISCYIMLYYSILHYNIFIRAGPSTSARGCA